MNNEINYVSPFKRFCITVGNLPTAYIESMSYYEGLTYLVNYLSNNVIPALNNNSAVVEELQEQFTILKNFVDNYFENLDVQQEINNKLDEMASDGTLLNIVSQYMSDLPATFSFDTINEMKLSENLEDGNIAQTLGHTNINDGGHALYKIRTKTNADVIDDNTIIQLYDENLVAVLISFIQNREQQLTKNHFNVNANRLTGISKSSRYPIVQQEDEDNCIEVHSNESVIEHVRVSNPNNYANKTGIDFKYPGQRQKVDSVYIDNGFETGMNIPKAYYSQFEDVWATGDTAIKIGDEDNPSEWIGVLDFESCHVNGSDLGVNEVASDTNTICFDKCSFENNLKCIKNNGKMYFKNTYFGDTPSTQEDVNVLESINNSETYFDECTLGLNAQNYTDTPKVNSLIELKNNSKVYINGGIINLSNNGITNSKSAIYDTNSNTSKLFIDNVKFIPSSGNNHHNQIPYRLLEGYSPLRSLNPVKNYILNGTLNNALGNAIYCKGHANNSSDIDPNLTNPFGGKCATYTRSTNTGEGYTTFFFKIPERLVGKQMVLETYIWTNSQYTVINAPNLSLPTNYSRWDNENSERTRPVMRRRIVTPTTTDGKVDIFIHWSDHTDTASYLVAGVILKEIQYEDVISCYQDSDDIMTNVTPTVTTGAVKGDMIYATHDSAANCLGWIYDGEAWQVYHSYA